MQKNTLFGIAFLIALGSIFGGFWAPNGRNFCLHFGHFLALRAILGPRWPPDPSKRPPGSILDRFGIDLGLILDDFWMIVGPILDDCSLILVMFSQSIDAFVGTVAEWPKATGYI